MNETSVALVLPVLDELDNLLALLPEISTELPHASVILVDGSSSDAISDALPRLRAIHPKVHLLRTPHRSGFAHALFTGYQCALKNNYTTILQMDADGSHPPTVLPQLLAALDKGASVVVGSRRLPGGSAHRGMRWSRRALSYCAAYCVRSCGRVDAVSDPTSGLRGFSAAALCPIAATPPQCRGFAVQVEFLMRAVQLQLPVCEVPFHFAARRHGHSKFRLSMGLELLALLLGSATELPSLRKCNAPVTRV
jgi:dolichol-phosphate mannosyltransferase